eukprot:1306879-Pleurochrysis_carterae.AAC.1
MQVSSVCNEAETRRVGWCFVRARRSHPRVAVEAAEDEVLRAGGDARRHRRRRARRGDVEQGGDLMSAQVARPPPRSARGHPRGDSGDKREKGREAWVEQIAPKWKAMARIQCWTRGTSRRYSSTLDRLNKSSTEARSAASMYRVIEASDRRGNIERVTEALPEHATRAFACVEKCDHGGLAVSISRSVQPTDQTSAGMPCPHLRGAEVGQLAHAVRVDEHVGALDVAVDDAPQVEVREAVQHHAQ